MSTPIAVIRYLAELDSALADRGVTDRDAVVRDVGEHIDDALREIDRPTDADVAAVLAALGDPLAIAQETAGLEPDAQTPSEETGATRAESGDQTGERRRDGIPWLARPWVPVIAVVLYLVAEVQVLYPLATTGVRIVGVDYLTLVILNVWWLIGLAAVILSPLFRVPGRVIWGVSLPIVALVVPLLVRDLFGSPYPADAALGHIVAFGLPIIAAGVAVWLSVRAMRRARQPALSH